jgi:hypothetical protein
MKRFRKPSQSPSVNCDSHKIHQIIFPFQKKATNSADRTASFFHLCLGLEWRGTVIFNSSGDQNGGQLGGVVPESIGSAMGHSLIGNVTKIAKHYQDSKCFEENQQDTEWLDLSQGLALHSAQSHPARNILKPIEEPIMVMLAKHDGFHGYSRAHLHQAWNTNIFSLMPRLLGWPFDGSFCAIHKMKILEDDFEQLYIRFSNIRCIRTFLKQLAANWKT